MQLTLFLTMSRTRQVLVSLLLREETLVTWAFWRWASLFKFLKKFLVAYELGQHEKLIDYTFIILGRWKSCDQNLNVSRTKIDVASKQKPDRFPSVGDHISATTTFEHVWTTPRHTVWGMVSISKRSQTFEL